MTFWFQTLFPHSFDEEIHLENFDYFSLFPSVTDTSLSLLVYKNWPSKGSQIAKLREEGGRGLLNTCISLI